MCCGNIFLLGLTSRHKAFSAGLECPAGQWPWYTKDSAHKNRTQGEKRRREDSAVWRKGCNIFPQGMQVSQGEWDSRLKIKYLLFSKKMCSLSGCRLQEAGGEVVLKEIPFPMWPHWAWGDLSVRLPPLAGKGMGELDKVHQTWALKNRPNIPNILFHLFLI